MHVHVYRGKGQDSQCKVWMDTLQIAWNYGFGKQELRDIMKILVEHTDEIQVAWEKTKS